MAIEKKYYFIGGGLLILLVVALLMMAMVKPTNPNVTIPTGNAELIWWKTFETSENLQDLVNEYQQLHKNVKITFVKKDIAGFEKELIESLAAGNGPDIFSIHNDWLPKHADKISAMPTSMMSIKQFKDAFVDVAFADFVKEDKIYSLPLSVDVLAMYYNKDLLNSASIYEVPKTWPDLVKIVSKLTTQTRPGVFDRSAVAMGTGGNINRAVDILTLLMLQNGTEFYNSDLRSCTIGDNADGQANYNPGVSALEFYTQFANPAKTVYNWNSKSENSIDAFTQGKLAFMFGYAYLIPTIKAKAPNLNWDLAPVPQPAEDVLKVNIANYWGESVSRNAKYPALAWDFLNFATQKQNLQKYYAKHNLPSSRKDILATQAQDTEIGVFADNALTAKSVYKKDANSFEGIFLKMIDDVILRNFTPSEAVNNAVQQMNLILQKE
jgi:multiple sugar transport system substrate-binding protein